MTLKTNKLLQNYKFNLTIATPIVLCLKLRLLHSCLNIIVVHYIVKILKIQNHFNLNIQSPSQSKSLQYS